MRLIIEVTMTRMGQIINSIIRKKAHMKQALIPIRRTTKIIIQKRTRLKREIMITNTKNIRISLVMKTITHITRIMTGKAKLRAKESTARMKLIKRKMITDKITRSFFMF